jgi:hypothetical protein
MYGPHTAAGVLKEFFRELPEPIMSYALYPEFLKLAGNDLLIHSTKDSIEIATQQIVYILCCFFDISFSYSPDLRSFRRR